MFRFAAITTLAAFCAAQVPAPIYSACGPTVACAAPAVCQANVCMPVQAAPPPPPPPAVYAAPPPPPMVYAAPPPPPPVYAAPAPVAPAYVRAPVVPVAAPAPVIAAQPVACAPACVGNAACVGGACQCTTPGVVYSPVAGCAAVPAVPVAPAPVIAGRLIPQALPGAPCEPGVECTGGSVCSLGVCLCPPELVQEGTVCVARTIYGVVPPPVVPVVPTAVVALGAPCAAPVVAAAPVQAAPCVQGAVCSSGVCQCAPSFAPMNGACVRRK